MSDENPAAADVVHDRQLLLAGAKRNTVLTLAEVRRYGTDSFGDADYVSVYGMRPADWYAAGVRLLGRTAVECTRDELAEAMASDIAALAGSSPRMSAPLVLDPFVGSGNTLYWIHRRLPDSRCLGFELDDAVLRLTRDNLEIASSAIEARHTDFAVGLAELAAPTKRPMIAFLAPPWGDALHPARGLDLGRTTPPVGAVVDELIQRFAPAPLLFAVQIYEQTEPASVADVQARFAWSDRRSYQLNRPGQNHGLLLGTQGWTP